MFCRRSNLMQTAILEKLDSRRLDMRCLIVCVASIFLVLSPPITRLLAAEFNVGTFSDSQDAAPGDGICADTQGNCSLRAAVMEANALTGDDRILLPEGTHTLTLKGAETDDAAANDLDASGDTLTIVGSGTGPEVVVDATALADRVFEVRNGATLDLENLTITGGHSSDYGGGILVADGGALVLDHVAITGNQAGNNGGGIGNRGTVTGDLVSIAANAAMEDGGGIYLASANDNSVTLTRSLIAGNSADIGGGIFNGGNGNYDSPIGGKLRLENVTISENNAAQRAGAILFDQGSSAYLVNCTVADNVTASSSSGAGMAGNGAPALDFLNTLVADNRSSSGLDNCYQIVESTSISQRGLNDAYFDQNVPFGHNMSDGGCFSAVGDVLLDSDLTTSDALAGAGTYRLLGGSPAIDAGDPENYPSEDVFGTARPEGDAPDIGAYEDSNAAPEAPVLAAPADAATVSGTSVTLSWQPSSDPEGAAVHYRLELAQDAAFTSALQSFWVDGNGQEILFSSFGAGVLLLTALGWCEENRKRRALVVLAAGVLLAVNMLAACGSDSSQPANQQDSGNVTFQADGLATGTTYYWRVTALDEQNKPSEYSDIWSFTTPNK